MCYYDSVDPNKNVIMWLVLFTPLGLVRIWTLSTWSRKIKITVTILVVLYFLAILASSIIPILYVERLYSDLSI